MIILKTVQITTATETKRVLPHWLVGQSIILDFNIK